MIIINKFIVCQFYNDFDEINDHLKRFLELESIGTKHDDPKISQTDQAQHMFEKTVKFIGDRYKAQSLKKRD